jgi:predicted nucleotidyltransferase
MGIMDISKSKLTRDLLGFYFANADKMFYLRELERILHHSVGNIRRQLLKYEESGLFCSARKGNLVYYGLNKSFPLYDELKSIVTKTIGVTGVLKDALSKISGLKLAFIYGSFAKGTENKESDIDICIVGHIDNYKLISTINSLEKKLHREVNYTLLTENEFREKAKENGSFINIVIKGETLPLKGDINTYA